MPSITTGDQTAVISQLLALLVDVMRQNSTSPGGGPTDAVSGGQLVTATTGRLDPGLATSLGGTPERGWSVGTPLTNYEMVDTALGGQSIIGGGAAEAMATGTGWDPGPVTLGGTTSRGWSIGDPAGGDTGFSSGWLPNGGAIAAAQPTAAAAVTGGGAYPANSGPTNSAGGAPHHGGDHTMENGTGYINYGHIQGTPQPGGVIDTILRSWNNSTPDAVSGGDWRTIQDGAGTQMHVHAHGPWLTATPDQLNSAIQAGQLYVHLHADGTLHLHDK